MTGGASDPRDAVNFIRHPGRSEAETRDPEFESFQVRDSPGDRHPGKIRDPEYYSLRV